jgi:hypothetical protein
MAQLSIGQQLFALVPPLLVSTLIRNEVVQVGEPREKRLLAAPRMMEALHREQLPLDSVMGLIQQRAGHGHLGICKDRILARLLGLKPLAHTVASGLPGCVRDVVRKAPQSLAQRKHPYALPLACPVPQGVELGAQRLAERGRDGREFLREFEECVAQADAEACPRKQRAHTLGGAVESIGEDPFDPIRRLLVDSRMLKHPIRLGEGRRTGLLGIAEMPHHPATDYCGQIHLVGQAVTVLLVGEEIDGQW